jgi:tellurite resistance protein TerC
MTELAWAPAIPAAALVAVVAAEVMLALRGGRGALTVRSAAGWAAAYASLAVLFGLATAISSSWTAAGQFYTGYLTEYSLSLDNLFIFYVIMTRLAVPSARQHRVLMAGIALALVLRSVLIVAGTTAVSHAGWLFYPFGALLVWTAIGLIRGRAHQPGEEHARLLSWLDRHAAPAAPAADPGGTVIQRSARPAAASLLVLAAAIGAADVLFAFDSIPAIFGITTSAQLIIACNVFALMGLRQLYVLLTRVIDRMPSLNQGLAVICGFIGVKLLLHAARDSGARWAPDIPTWLSMLVVAVTLLATVAAGLLAGRRATGNRPATAAAGPGAERVRSLSSGQRAVFDRRFVVLDTDQNGVWELADYERQARRLCGSCGHALDSLAGQAVAAAQRTLFSALLAHMDANGDRQISPDEFAAAGGRAIGDRPGFDAAVAATAHSLIQAADRDGNGVLDAAEYARLAAAYGASTRQAAQAFAQLDLDGNGVLDTAELTQGISQFFTSPDPSAPGNLAFGRLGPDRDSSRGTLRPLRV